MHKPKLCIIHNPNLARFINLIKTKAEEKYFRASIGVDINISRVHYEKQAMIKSNC